jgi:hypothetical protein
MIVPFLLSLLSTSPVFATIIRSNGIAAIADWPGPVGQFSNIYLAADKSNAGTDVLLL